MPLYVIERQYLVPMYEHIIVDAQNFEAACRYAVHETKQCWGDDTRIDYENSRPTTVERAIKIPNWADLDASDSSLSYLLYDAGLEPLRIPSEFADESEGPGAGVGFV